MRLPSKVCRGHWSARLSSVLFDTSVLNLSYVLLLQFVLAHSYFNVCMFLALKMFVLEGQDFKCSCSTRPGCLFIVLQDVLLPHIMDDILIFVQFIFVEYSSMPVFSSSKVRGFSLFSSLASWVNVSVLQ